MSELLRALGSINQWRLWRREVEVWDCRMTAVSFDRLLNLYLHRLGLMNSATRSFLRDNVRPGMRVVDVGANQGLITLLLASLTGPSGTVDAFEPDPELFAVLERNCRANPASNVRLHHAALGARRGSMVLERSLLNAGDNRLAPGLSNGSFRSETVTVVPMAEALSGEAVDFVKVDVQGWEWEVAQGMEAVLHANPNIAILFEFWPYGLERAGCPPSRLLDFFRQHGFHLSEARAGRCLDIGDGQELYRRLTGKRYTDLFATRRKP